MSTKTNMVPSTKSTPPEFVDPLGQFGQSAFEGSIGMLVFRVLGRFAADRSIGKLDLDVDRTEFRFGVVGVPADCTVLSGFPPLNPVVWSITGQVELGPEPGFLGGIVSAQKRGWIDLGHDLVGIPFRRFVPDRFTAAEAC